MSDETQAEGARPSPSRFDEVLGHEAPLTLVRRALASGRLPHALVFQGPEGVGKGTVARLLAAALLCDEPRDGPCGQCLSCRRTAHASHPDWVVVGRESRKAKGQANESEAGADEPDPGDSGGEASRVIKVSQIRDLTIHAAYAPREGKWRVLSVDPADRMNASAQNALLKTLEEPPGRAVLILVTSRPHMLLPTVRSRCLSVRFAAMPVPDLAARLEALGFDRAEALMRAALAGGRAGAALRLKLAEVRDRREAVLATLEGLARDRGALAELGRANALLLGDGEESTLLEGLDLIEAILRDAALSASRAPASALVHADLAPRIEALGLRLGRSRAATLVRAVERLRADLRFNPNEKIMADCLWAAIAGGPVP